MARTDLTRERLMADDPEETVPVGSPISAAPGAGRWARTSAAAILGLMVGMFALLSTLSGLLAPVGVVLGVVGGALSAGGLAGARKPGVTGHGPAVIGLLFSLLAVALGVLAIGGQLSWLDNKTDEVSRLHDWLNGHLPWIKSF
ncbi:MAG: hypothetical protein J2P15_04860 [Micromonosporaceae bacterium]|nr:hypothetical protein [Micromonosporaceae bacterium]